MRNVLVVAAALPWILFVLFFIAALILRLRAQQELAAHLGSAAYALLLGPFVASFAITAATLFALAFPEDARVMVAGCGIALSGVLLLLPRFYAGILRFVQAGRKSAVSMLPRAAVLAFRGLGAYYIVLAVLYVASSLIRRNMIG